MERRRRGDTLGLGRREQAIAWARDDTTEAYVVATTFRIVAVRGDGTVTTDRPWHLVDAGHWDADGTRMADAIRRVVARRTGTVDYVDSQRIVVRVEGQGAEDQLATQRWDDAASIARVVVDALLRDGEAVRVLAGGVLRGGSRQRFSVISIIRSSERRASRTTAGLAVVEEREPLEPLPPLLHPLLTARRAIALAVAVVRLVGAVSVLIGLVTMVAAAR